MIRFRRLRFAGKRVDSGLLLLTSLFLLPFVVFVFECVICLRVLCLFTSSAIRFHFAITLTMKLLLWLSSADNDSRHVVVYPAFFVLPDHLFDCDMCFRIWNSLTKTCLWKRGEGGAFNNSYILELDFPSHLRARIEMRWRIWTARVRLASSSSSFSAVTKASFPCNAWHLLALREWELM